MKLYFCDLCNESVPHSDLEVGKAFIRKSRVVCASCDEAMSAALASGKTSNEASDQSGAGAGGAPIFGGAAQAHDGQIASSQRPPRRSSTGLAAVGLWIGVIALFVAAGTLMFTLQELEAGRNAFAEADEEGTRQALNQLALAEERSSEQRAALEGSIQDLGTRVETHRTELIGRLGEADKNLVEAGKHADVLRGEIADMRADLGKTTSLQDQQLRGFDAELERYDEEIRFFGERINELEVQILTKEFIAEQNVVSPAEASSEKAAWLSILPDLQSEESGDRWAAVQALGETRDVAVAEHLIPILRDRDIFVRMATARVLGDLKAEIAVPNLIDTLEDVEVAVQEAAVVSLRSITGRNFGFEIEANEKDRAKRIKAWRTWWKKAGEKPAKG